MEKGKASRKIRKVLKDLMPALCKCNAYVDISLHFDNDKNDEFIIVTIGYINDNVFTSKNQFWFSASSSKEVLANKVVEFNECVELKYL